MEKINITIEEAKFYAAALEFAKSHEGSDPGEFADEMVAELMEACPDADLWRELEVFFLPTRFTYGTRYYAEAEKQQASGKQTGDVYMGMSLDDYEKERLDSLQEFKEADVFGAIPLFQEKSEKLDYALKMIANNHFVRLAADRAFRTEVAERMIQDGVTLPKIAEYLNTGILEVYRLALSAGMKLTLTDEEVELVLDAEENENGGLERK